MKNYNVYKYVDFCFKTCPLLSVYQMIDIMYRPQWFILKNSQIFYNTDSLIHKFKDNESFKTNLLNFEFNSTFNFMDRKYNKIQLNFC